MRRAIRLSLVLLGLGFLVSAALSRPRVDPRLRQAVALEGLADAILLFPKDPTSRQDLDPEATLDALKSRQVEMRAELESGCAGILEGASATDLWNISGLALRVDLARLQAVETCEGAEEILLDQVVEVPATTSSEQAHEEDSEANDYEWGLRRMGLPQIRSQFRLTGAGVKIGILDTGIDGDHPEFEDKILAWKDFRNQRSNPYDDDGHGTHVAGTLVGGSGSGKWIGMAPDAKLLVGKVLGAGKGRYTASVLEGMQWLMDPDLSSKTRDFPRVVNLSFHTGSGTQTAFYRAIESMDRLGIMASFSAGNKGSEGITHPKEHPRAFVTAAHRSTGSVPSFSSRGPTEYRGQVVRKPDWSCPGVSILSARAGGGYTRKNGTSMAAPHTTGLIALMLQRHPAKTPDQIRIALAGTAKDKGNTGWDGSYGFGFLEGPQAISALGQDEEAPAGIWFEDRLEARRSRFRFFEVGE